MSGAFSIEPKENGKLNIVFKVPDMCDVDMLTLDMMSYCDDILYEPRNRNDSYEVLSIRRKTSSIKVWYVVE